MISVILFISLNNFISNYNQNLDFKSELKNQEIPSTENTLIHEENNVLSEESPKVEESNLSNWYIEIPEISLRADINEGTTKEIMDNFVGHFEETSKEIGNVGLIAHNRGYKNNYFVDLKKLKEGDEVIYKYAEFNKTYIVVSNEIIKDTDWSKLEKTEENVITLITCVENQPEYRRCVQGIEKQERM